MKLAPTAVWGMSFHGGTFEVVRPAGATRPLVKLVATVYLTSLLFVFLVLGP